MDMIPYGFAFLVLALAAGLGWSAIKRQGQRDPPRFPFFKRVYLLFITFFAGLLVVLLATMSRPNAEVIYETLGLGSLTVLALVLFAVPIFLASLRLERRARRVFARRGAILLIGATLPLLCSDRRSPPSCLP